MVHGIVRICILIEFGKLEERSTEEVTEWEAESRYGDNLLVTKQRISEVLDIAERLYREISGSDTVSSRLEQLGADAINKVSED